MRHIVMFSSGIGSWAAARRLVDQQGTDGLTLLFADTLIEDEDNYRFLHEAAADIGAELVIVADGRTPMQVFRDVRYVGNSRIAPCSHLLKQQPAREWLAANCDPTATTIYLGIDWTERHRLSGACKGWLPWSVAAPRCEPPYRAKGDWLDIARDRGLQPPRLYGLGLSHANCGATCVRAGQSQWALVLNAFPERYAAWEHDEQEMRAYLDADVAILRDRTNGENAPLTLRALRERLEAGSQAPLFDWGGCGCFLDDEALPGLADGSVGR